MSACPSKVWPKQRLGEARCRQSKRGGPGQACRAAHPPAVGGHIHARVFILLAGYHQLCTQGLKAKHTWVVPCLSRRAGKERAACRSGRSAWVVALAICAPTRQAALHVHPSQAAIVRDSEERGAPASASSPLWGILGQRCTVQLRDTQQRQHAEQTASQAQAPKSRRPPTLRPLMYS